MSSFDVLHSANRSALSSFQTQRAGHLDCQTQHCPFSPGFLSVALVRSPPSTSKMPLSPERHSFFFPSCIQVYRQWAALFCKSSFLPITLVSSPSLGRVAEGTFSHQPLPRSPSLGGARLQPLRRLLYCCVHCVFPKRSLTLSHTESIAISLTTMAPLQRRTSSDPVTSSRFHVKNGRISVAYFSCTVSFRLPPCPLALILASLSARHSLNLVSVSVCSIVLPE